MIIKSYIPTEFEPFSNSKSHSAHRNTKRNKIECEKINCESKISPPTKHVCSPRIDSTSEAHCRAGKKQKEKRWKSRTCPHKMGIKKYTSFAMCNVQYQTWNPQILHQQKKISIWCWGVFWKGFCVSWGGDVSIWLYKSQLLSDRLNRRMNGVVGSFIDWLLCE